MRRPFHILSTSLCLLAVFLTVGGHWLALQSFAWGRMIVRYAESAPLTTAVAMTLDGDHPCHLCLRIRAGRAAEERQSQSPATPASRESLTLAVASLAPEPLPAFVQPPSGSRPAPFPSHHTRQGLPPSRPPVPPPRA